MCRHILTPTFTCTDIDATCPHRDNIGVHTWRYRDMQTETNTETNTDIHVHLQTGMTPIHMLMGT